MAKLFGFYEDWKTEVLVCPICGWKGTFEEGDVEMYQALMDSSCPDCDYKTSPMLAIVSWPTMDDIQQNWDKADEMDKAAFQMRRSFERKFAELCLKSAAELPEIEASEISITWDLVGDEPAVFTVLFHEDKEIWREPAIYEGYSRFEEVVEILKEKYKERLVDVEPTRRSELYLVGDSFGAIGAVEEVRNRIRRSDG